MAFDPNAEGAISNSTSFDPESLGAISSDMGAPSLSDYSASRQLESKAFNQKNTSNFNPLDEFSNPIKYPGFENLPKKEQLQRIQLAGFDPSNMTGIGTFLPPGTNQNPVVHTIYGLLTNLGMPEFSILKGTGILPSVVNNLSRTGASSAFGAIENPNDPLKGAEYGAAFSAIKPTISGINAIKNYYSPEVQSTNFLNKLSEGNTSSKNIQELPPGKNVFNNDTFQIPSFLVDQKKPNLSENIAQQLHSDITGNKDLESSGKNLAQSINQTYEGVNNASKNKFNDIFNSDTKNENIFTGEPIKVKDSRMYGSDYLEKYSSSDFDDKNIQSLHDKFLDEPSVVNAHRLQSELGSEIGYLTKQKSKGLLENSGKEKLNDYSQQRKTLINDINNTISGSDPSLMNSYTDAQRSWRSNVLPYHSDKDLKSIAEGKTKNPTQGQIISIFKNPEENINKVMSDLPEDAKNNIIHIGMGIGKYDNSPKDITNGFKSLDKKGLSSYVSPYNSQNYMNLKNNLDLENSFDVQSKSNEKTINVLKKAYDTSEKNRIALSKNSLSNYNIAKKQSDYLVNNKNNEIQKNYENLIKKNMLKNSIIKGTVLSGLGALAAHYTGIKPEDILGAYMGKYLSNLFNKH